MVGDYYEYMNHFSLLCNIFLLFYHVNWTDTNCHGIAEILLKLALNINQSWANPKICFEAMTLHNICSRV